MTKGPLSVDDRGPFYFILSDRPATELGQVFEPHHVGDANTADQLPTVPAGLPRHVQRGADAVLWTAPHDGVGFGVVLDTSLVAGPGRHITEAPFALALKAARASRFAAVVASGGGPVVRADQDRADLLTDAVPTFASCISQTKEVAVPARPLLAAPVLAVVQGFAAQGFGSSYLSQVVTGIHVM